MAGECLYLNRENRASLMLATDTYHDLDIYKPTVHIPRKFRTYPPDVPVHVIQRGNNRQHMYGLLVRIKHVLLLVKGSILFSNI